MENDIDELRRSLIGRWVKVTNSPAAEPYPDSLEFTERGIFAGTTDAKSRWHPIWDTGLFQIDSAGKVKLPTSNDAVIEYSVKVTDDDLAFSTLEHGDVQYKRDKVASHSHTS